MIDNSHDNYLDSSQLSHKNLSSHDASDLSNTYLHHLHHTAYIVFSGFDSNQMQSHKEQLKLLQDKLQCDSCRKKRTNRLNEAGTQLQCRIQVLEDTEEIVDVILSIQKSSNDSTRQKSDKEGYGSSHQIKKHASVSTSFSASSVVSSSITFIVPDRPLLTYKILLASASKSPILHFSCIAASVSMGRWLMSPQYLMQHTNCNSPSNSTKYNVSVSANANGSNITNSDANMSANQSSNQSASFLWTNVCRSSVNTMTSGGLENQMQSEESDQSSTHMAAKVDSSTGRGIITGDNNGGGANNATKLQTPTRTFRKRDRDNYIDKLSPLPVLSSPNKRKSPGHNVTPLHAHDISRSNVCNSPQLNDHEKFKKTYQCISSSEQRLSPYFQGLRIGLLAMKRDNLMKMLHIVQVTGGVSDCVFANVQDLLETIKKLPQQSESSKKKLKAGASTTFKPPEASNSTIMALNETLDKQLSTIRSKNVPWDVLVCDWREDQGTRQDESSSLQSSAVTNNSNSLFKSLVSATISKLSAHSSFTSSSRIMDPISSSSQTAIPCVYYDFLFETVRRGKEVEMQEFDLWSVDMKEIVTAPDSICTSVRTPISPRRKSSTASRS
jgi:hypothetical protein